MAIGRAVSRLLTADEAGQRLGLAPRSLLDRRFRLRVVLVGHRAREDLYVSVASRRNAASGSLGLPRTPRFVCGHRLQGDTGGRSQGMAC